MNKTLFFLCLPILLLTACNQGGGEEVTYEEEVSNSYPILPNERGERLFAEVDYMDIIFHNLPVSMNLQGANAQRSITHINAMPVTNFCGGSAAMRITYLSQGNILEEADVYHGTAGCNYYVWLENGKPAYANTMNEQGVGFFNNMINNVNSGSGN